MPTAPNSASMTNPLAPPRRVVQVKRDWGGQWEYVPYLTALRCSDAVAPEMPSADFLYRFGTIKRSDRSALASYGPLQLTGYFVRILLVNQYSAQRLWTGIMTDEQTALVSAEREGAQNFRAYGLAHVLDQIELNKTYALDRDELQELEWVPPFNQRHRRGKTLLGNRSAEAAVPADLPNPPAGISPPPGDFYVFSRDGERWTNRQIIEHLLFLYAPTQWKTTLSGQAEILETITEVHRLEGKTLWQALNILIDRRRGAGFVLEVDDAGTVYARVFSTAERETQVGERTLPANPDRLVFRVPTAYPANHLLGDIAIRKTDVARVSTLIVQSERIKVVGTFSFADETLEPNWSPDLEEEYRTGPTTETAKENDAFRARDKFQGVYTSFRVAADWDGWCGDGAGGAKKNLWIGTAADGLIYPEEQKPFWRFAKEFQRDLPFEVGKTYDEEEETDENLEDAEPEFRPLTAWIKDEEAGPKHSPSDLWLYVDRLSEYDSMFPNVGVRPLDKDLGIELHVSPRHYFARGHWDDAKPTFTEPEFDYEDLVVTACLELDTRIRITLERMGGPRTDIETQIVITVEGAEFWYAPSSVVWDTDADGKPSKVHGERRILRTDGDQLEAAAAQALAWFGLPRQAVQIPIKQIGYFARLGSMLSGIESVYLVEPVGTPITGRAIDFLGGSTVIETGYVALDFAGAQRQ